jgi:O-glycosyl hydrolase
MQNGLRSILSILAMAVLCIQTQTALADTVEITVNPKARYQTMSGWEVTARAMELGKQYNHFDPEWHNFSDAMFDTLVNEIGVNRIRLSLRSGFENTTDFWSQFVKGEISYEDFKANFYNKVNDNNDPNATNSKGFQFSQLDYQVTRMLHPMMERAKKNGERIYVNLCFVDFDKGQNKTRFNHADSPEEYAELVAAAFVHLKKQYGIVPDALEVILEPDFTARWKNSGRQIGEAAAAAMRRLTNLGFSPELILPSTKRADLAVSLFEQALQVPGVRQHVGAIAYHRYSKATPDVVRGIAETARRYGVRSEMLEYVQGSAYHLHLDMEQGVSAWQSYSIGAWRRPDNKPTRGTLLYIEPDTGAVYPSTQGLHMMQYMRYVRLDAQRIGASTSVPAFATVAFENKDGGQVVVVRADAKGPIVIRGMKPDNYSATYANWKSGGNPVQVISSQSGEMLTVNMPVKGELTVFPSRMVK